MQGKSHKIFSVVLGMLLLAGWVSGVLQAQQNPPPNAGGPGGARQSFEAFNRAIAAGDLTLLNNGAAISGTVQGDQFTFIVSDSGQSRTLNRSEIALINFGEKSDQLVLTTGSTLTGTVQMDQLTILLSTGAEVTIPKAETKITIFKLNLPVPTAGPPSEADRAAMFKIMQGLRSQNLFALFVKALTTYDLAVLSNQQLWSGTIVNQQFVFHTTLFGTVTLKASDVTSIELAADPTTESDYISMKTGDRISGVLDEGSSIQFQPVGLEDGQGQALTLTLNRGDVARVSFRLPASAFGGGGQGPGFGGGPGK
ncbi:MAG: hypothetical protein A2Z21_03990 [Candidatus Fraserbacteria bacterium RBG_16_55_9]|uniref:DUF5666 domain-containing protein n=1 Tax=Fraserbacteria sp. (strain RBG_16_55_9) TaxID=1817864 RepID=A0A1F5UYT2_FRAXR|nr:MAG: hypothetical protein A2Z21_03990 [Candidatus Fraserbacteria bacterium RBG_16_55_9]